MKKSQWEDFYCSKYRLAFHQDVDKTAGRWRVAEKKSSRELRGSEEEYEDEEEYDDLDVQEEGEMNEDEEEEETIRRWYWLMEWDELHAAMMKGKILSGE